MDHNLRTESKSNTRLLGTILRRTTLLIALLLGSGVFVYIGLTYTEVGRNYLRHEIEALYAEKAPGHVTIESVSGNLLKTVHLRNIVFYDEHERIWLHVDEIITQPNWNALTRWQIELPTLTIVSPTILATYHTDNAWNLTPIIEFIRNIRPLNWELESSQLFVSDGAVKVGYEKDAPRVIQSGWMFDMARTEITDIYMESELNLTPNRRLLAIKSLKSSLDSLEIEANGEFLSESKQIFINSLNISSAKNEVSVVGSLDPLDQTADLSLVSSYLTPEFANVFAPALRLPIPVVISAQISRDTSEWSLQNLIASSDRSYIDLGSSEIQVDPDQISFHAEIESGMIDPEDLNGIIPPNSWSGGAIQIAGHIEGARIQDEFELAGAITLATETGSQGHIQGFAHHDSIWSYEAELTGQGIDLYDPTGMPVLRSTMNGYLSVQGAGIRAPSVSASLALSPSTIGEHSLDSLWIEGTLSPEQLNVSGFAVQGESQLTTMITSEWTAGKVTYDAQGDLNLIDLGPLLAVPELETNLNAGWTLEGAGIRLDDLSALLTINTDSSTVVWDDSLRLLPPTHWSIALRDTSATAPRLSIQGDVLDLDVSGTFDQESLLQIGRIWGNAFSELFRQFASHQRTEVQPEFEDQPSPLSATLQTLPEQEITLSSPIELGLIWKLHGHPATDVLFPMVPSFSTNTQGSSDLWADTSSLRAQIRIQDEHLIIDDLAAYQAEAILTLNANSNREIASDWDIHLDVRADSLTNDRLTIPLPRILMNQKGREGRLEFFAGKENAKGHLSTEIDLFLDRTRVRVHDALVPFRNAEWRLLQPADINLFADAIVLTPLKLQSKNSSLDQEQMISVQGSLSSLLSDSLRLNLEGVDLAQLSNALELRRPMGGLIDADLVWTGLWQPEITGTLEIDTLTLNQALVGHLEASSILQSGTSNLRINVTIDSLETAPHDHAYARNQVSMQGEIIVPGTGHHGALDLSMDVDYLDASLGQFVTRSVGRYSGRLHGKIGLAGPFSDPLLDGSLLWEDGHIWIPKFNSSYDLKASLNLSGDQILLEQMELRDPEGGKARVQGIINLNDFQFISFDASADLDSLQIMNVLSHTREYPFYGDVRVSGDATLTGPTHTAFLRSDNLIVSPQSEINIPVRDPDARYDPGFIVYVDPTQPIERQLALFGQRENILELRPEGERRFRDGLDMDLNLVGPPGSSIRLVIDPLLGDRITGIGNARLQVQRTGGEVATYGFFEFSSGDYLFTAGDVFVRRFLIDSGTITWTGEPRNPTLDIQGAYRTRASRSGLPDDVGGAIQTSLPLIVNLDLSGTLTAVMIDLGLEIDQRQEVISDTPLLDSYLNRPDLATEHATSVLLTNSFLLSSSGSRSGILTSSAVNSVSSLVTSRLNRYLSQVIPQADFQFGVQSDETIQDLDVSAGIALRLLNERLVIRGQGIYRGLNTEEIAPQGLEGEFIVEIKLSPSVGVEFFYRREGDVLSESLITSETGLGLNYRAEFTSWRRLFQRMILTTDQ